MIVSHPWGEVCASSIRAMVIKQVRRAPSWPRGWANFSLLWLHSHRNAWAKVHPLGQPNTDLSRCRGSRRRMKARPPPPLTPAPGRAATAFSRRTPHASAIRLSIFHGRPALRLSEGPHAGRGALSSAFDVMVKLAQVPAPGGSTGRAWANITAGLQ
jgi:hypothetical protein